MKSDDVARQVKRGGEVVRKTLRDYTVKVVDDEELSSNLVKNMRTKVEHKSEAETMIGLRQIGAIEDKTLEEFG